MLGHIHIETKGTAYYFGTAESEKIYDVLTGLAFEHEEAENIASWAENAPIGEEYETERAVSIWIGD